jgi:hypothetical protein
MISMLRLLGNPKRLCDGLTRRDFLHIGGLGAFGLGLADALRLQAAELSKGNSFGHAKACILLFPYGSPPQHETFDPKPDAPAEIQGEMKSIGTAIPGVRVGEGIPEIAKIADRLCIVRSITHPYPEHGVAYAVSGIPTYTPVLETAPRDSRHWPFIGSVVDYLDERSGDGSIPAVPRNIGLPWLLNSKTDLNVSAGPYAAFLGQGYDPVWTDFDGPGTKVAPKYSEGQKKAFDDPFAETALAGRFKVSTLANHVSDLPDERVAARRSLLEQFDAANRKLDVSHNFDGFDRHRRSAFTLLASGKMRQALDLTREPDSVREGYGRTLFGQSCLAARRLIEAGSRFVTVFWDGYGVFETCAWDTHANHYPRLKEYLLPGFDRAYPALIRDMEARGLLNETLVLWMSEHGRTPKIDSRPKGAGRHHWSKAYSIVMAGGGAPRGTVVGSTDKHAGEVKDTPISPKDILATSFHLLGIDPHTTVMDRQGKPVPIAGEGRVRKELLT